MSALWFSPAPAGRIETRSRLAKTSGRRVVAERGDGRIELADDQDDPPIGMKHKMPGPGARGEVGLHRHAKLPGFRVEGIGQERIQAEIGDDGEAVVGRHPHAMGVCTFLTLRVRPVAPMGGAGDGWRQTAVRPQREDDNRLAGPLIFASPMP